MLDSYGETPHALVGRATAGRQHGIRRELASVVDRCAHGRGEATTRLAGDWRGRCCSGAR